MKITKVKYDGTKTRIEWGDRIGAGSLTHAIDSLDPPHKDLPAALDGLIEPVLRALGLPSTYRDGIVVTGVSMTWSGDDGNDLGVVVTMQKDLPGYDAPLVLNTPYTPDPSWPIEPVIFAAEDYIRGIREQGDLFAEQVAEDLDRRMKEKFGDGVSVTAGEAVEA